MWINKQRGISHLLDYLLPPICLLCRGDCASGETLCTGCRTELPWIYHPCTVCAIPLATDNSVCGQCLSSAPSFDRALSVFTYHYPVRQMIVSFKHHKNLHFGRSLAQYLAAYLSDSRRLGERPEVLVPVPLHPDRARERGYNQARLIGEVLSESLNIPIANGLVRRTIKSPSQSSLDRHARASNVSHVFQLAVPHDYSSIAIIDDVLTTGATASELARLLREDKNTKIQVWTLARTQTTGHKRM